MIPSSACRQSPHAEQPGQAGHAWRPCLSYTTPRDTIFLWGVYLGIYHAGVEWKFWAGPTACTGTGSNFGFDALANLNDARFVPCDQVQFRFLGLSLAGWNVLATLLISTLIGFSLRSSGKATVNPASEAKP